MRAPTRSPYLSLSCRAAASRSGTAIETWLSPVTINKPLNDLRLAQFGDGLVVEAKLAGEDFLAVLAERDHPVGGLIGRIRHDARMAVAEPAGVAPGGEIARGHVDEHRQRRFVQRDLDLLALAGAVARVERREDGVRCEHAGADVDDR